MTIEQQNKILRAALLECDRQANCARVWGGQGWHYNPLHPRTAEKIVDTVRAALEAIK